MTIKANDCCFHCDEWDWNLSRVHLGLCIRAVYSFAWSSDYSGIRVYACVRDFGLWHLFFGNSLSGKESSFTFPIFFVFGLKIENRMDATGYWTVLNFNSTIFTSLFELFSHGLCCVHTAASKKISFSVLWIAQKYTPTSSKTLYKQWTASAIVKTTVMICGTIAAHYKCKSLKMIASTGAKFYGLSQHRSLHTDYK